MKADHPHLVVRLSLVHTSLAPIRDLVYHPLFSTDALLFLRRQDVRKYLVLSATVSVQRTLQSKSFAHLLMFFFNKRFHYCISFDRLICTPGIPRCFLFWIRVPRDSLGSSPLLPAASKWIVRVSMGVFCFGKRLFIQLVGPGEGRATLDE